MVVHWHLLVGIELVVTGHCAVSCTLFMIVIVLNVIVLNLDGGGAAVF